MDSVALALEASNICRKNKAEYKININGSVEVEAYKPMPFDRFYKVKGTVRDFEELPFLDYRLKHNRSPD